MSCSNLPDPCKDVDCGAGLKCAPLGRSYSCLGKKEKKAMCSGKKKNKQPMGSLKPRLHGTVEILLQIAALFAVQRLAWFPRVLCILCKCFPFKNLSRPV